MNNRRAIFAIGLGACLVMLLFVPWKKIALLPRTEESNGKKRPESGPLKDSLDTPPSVGATPPVAAPNQLADSLNTPIQFFGVVLDQYDSPVANAQVDVSVLDNLKDRTLTSLASDASGKFSISTRGASLHIEVSKRGYHRIDRGSKRKPSTQGFDYVDSGKGVFHADPATPVVFNLRKQGEKVHLEHLSAHPSLPRDGQSIEVGKGDCNLTIGCTTSDIKAANGQFDWKCTIEIKEGGVQLVTSEEDFTAPEGGYQPSAIVDMPHSLPPEKWRDEMIVNYWLRFKDDTFGRIRLRVIPGGDHFAVIDGYRNPTPGSRNLEPITLDR